METNTVETELESIERAAELLSRLLDTADGGSSVSVDQYYASTILALLMDNTFRMNVMSRLDEFADIDIID